MLSDWMWLMRSTINSGGISVRRSWPRSQTSISSGKSGIRPNLAFNGDETHAVMNYPLSESIKDYFLRGHKETQRFIWEINSQSMYYRQQISEVMFNLLDSHDTERILTTAKGNLQSVKSALSFLYLLQRENANIYYGTN